MIKLNPRFRALGNPSGPRYYLITGGRGASKSFGVSTYICAKTRFKGHKTLFSRYAMTTAHDSIIPEFEEKISLMNYGQEFYSTRTKIIHKDSRSEVLFRGIMASGKNQTARLKSIKGVDTWVLEEGEELLSEETFDTIDLSIRHPLSKNEVIIIMNPTTIDHWVWGRWFENSHKHIMIDGYPVAISTHPDICHLHFTYLDNKHLPEQYLQRIEAIKRDNPAKYGHKIIGGWLEKAEGVIFENWRKGAYDLSLPSIYGLDWGYAPDPLAIIRVAVDQKRKLIYLQEVAYENRINDVGELFKNRGLLKGSDLIVSDTNEPRTISQLQRQGWNLQKAYKPSIVDSIREIHGYTLIVDPESYHLQKELNTYRWNDKKASIPIDDYNHLLDAMRYAYWRLVHPPRSGVRRTN